MKGVLLIVLVITLLLSSSLAGPVNKLQLTPPPGIQSQPSERGGPSSKPQYVSSFSVSPRLKRAAPVVPKTPVRICTGCFSVIGDPTIPQQ
ncbi:hypothetical protein NFI96_028620 [Prochilodus magdalenae]|nr:hypothetical protein NFI96_028620 [Prochilodus magdalenae]